MIKRRGQARLAVAACHDFGVWPDLQTDFSERATVFLRCATRKENSSAIDLLRQFGKDCAQTLGRSEPKIRWRQFSPIENAKFGAGCVPRLRSRPLPRRFSFRRLQPRGCAHRVSRLGMHNCSSAILKGQCRGRAGNPPPAEPRSARAAERYALPFRTALRLPKFCVFVS